MKLTRIFSILLMLMLAFNVAIAQESEEPKSDKKKEKESKEKVKDIEIQIKTEFMCQDCQYNLELKLKKEKGIKSFNFDFENDIINIIYSPKLINDELIRERISEEGFKADGITGNEDAKKSVMECCNSSERDIQLDGKKEDDSSDTKKGVQQTYTNDKKTRKAKSKF
jgi:copper chaperone CopZ